MSDTPQPKSLDALFVEPAKAGQQPDHPQATDKGAEENAQPQPKDQPKTDAEGKQESNEPAAKEETLEEKSAKLEKRLKDTQEWANKARREALDAKKRLQELGGLTADEETELATLTKEVEDPLTQAMSDFWARYAPVADFLKATGENPDEAIEAFKLVANGNKPLMEEFMQLKPEERVPWVLDKGRENKSLLTAMKEHGSLDKAFASLRETAKKEALEELKKQAGTAVESKETPKSTPKLPGSSTPPSGEYRRQDLSALMTKHN